MSLAAIVGLAIATVSQASAAGVAARVAKPETTSAVTTVNHRHHHHRHGHHMHRRHHHHHGAHSYYLRVPRSYNGMVYRYYTSPRIGYRPFYYSAWGYPHTGVYLDAPHRRYDMRRYD